MHLQAASTATRAPSSSSSSVMWGVPPSVVATVLMCVRAPVAPSTLNAAASLAVAYRNAPSADSSKKPCHHTQIRHVV